VENCENYKRIGKVNSLPCLHAFLGVRNFFGHVQYHRTQEGACSHLKNSFSGIWCSFSGFLVISAKAVFSLYWVKLQAKKCKKYI
jgi:hypothetical protein